MAVLPITLYGDKILRTKASPLKKVELEDIELIKNMFETMKNANGIGLAANQVGSDKSIFVVNISLVEGYEHIKPIAFINPRIINRSDDMAIFEEGCLSIPDVRFDVERPAYVKISYQDTDLIEHTIEADELLARVVQHEYDHLQGKLFTDYLPEEIKKKLKKSLEKISKRKIEVDYPVAETQDYQFTFRTDKLK